MKFPSALCGTWVLLFTSNKDFHSGIAKLEVDYEQITFVREDEIFPFINIQKQKKGYITKIQQDSNRIIWNKERQYTFKTPLFPSIIIPQPRKKLRGQRFIIEKDNEDDRWLSIMTRNETYTFRKKASPANDDFPAFHKLLITQLILTEIINGIIDELKLIHLDNIFMGITSIHLY